MGRQQPHHKWKILLCSSWTALALKTHQGKQRKLGSNDRMDKAQRAGLRQVRQTQGWSERRQSRNWNPEMKRRGGGAGENCEQTGLSILAMTDGEGRGARWAVTHQDATHPSQRKESALLTPKTHHPDRVHPAWTPGTGSNSEVLGHVSWFYSHFLE